MACKKIVPFTYSNFHIFTLNLASEIDECKSYTILDEKDRAAGYNGNTDKCDEREIATPAWYRFSGDAGDKMADTCVPTSHCGTHSPGWLKGAHPVKEGEIVQRKVCFHFGSRCCKWTDKIKVKKCKGFFVYELQRTPGCNLRYCGNSGQGKQKLVIYLSIFQILHYVGGC